MTPIIRFLGRLITTVLFTALIVHIAGAQSSKYKEEIYKRAKEVEPKVIEWRRDIHAHPELSNREFRTAELVAKHLESLGMEVTTGIAHTGVKAVLKGGHPGPVIALRADMDALPITERTDVPFASKVTDMFNGVETGVMHACGHDAHTAILMGAAELLSSMKDDLKGTVVFIFQPAEEGAPAGEEGGAKLMIKEGVLQNPAVDVIFGLHVHSALETGKIAYRPGGLMAGVSDFRIEIKGKGSHGSQPWSAVDPIAISSQIINDIQTIVSRNINLTRNPAVVSVGAIHGGNRSNIIPEKVEMLGTIRVFTNEDEQLIYKRLNAICKSVASASGAEAIVDLPYSSHLPVTFNNIDLTKNMLPTLQNVMGKDKVIEVPPSTGAEDFSMYAQEIPGLFFFLGTMPKGQDPKTAPGVHTPDLFLDESSFVNGVNAFSNLVFDFMENDIKQHISMNK